jgi:hypothetical protein
MHLFLNLEVGWAFGFGGEHKCYQRMTRVTIVESLGRGESVSLCYVSHTILYKFKEFFMHALFCHNVRARNRTLSFVNSI